MMMSYSKANHWMSDTWWEVQTYGHIWFITKENNIYKGLEPAEKKRAKQIRRKTKSETTERERERGRHICFGALQLEAALNKGGAIWWLGWRSALRPVSKRTVTLCSAVFVFIFVCLCVYACAVRRVVIPFYIYTETLKLKLISD